MFRKWKFIFLMILSLILLMGCGRSLEDRATGGIEAAREAFFANDKKPTEQTDGIRYYKPAGFAVTEDSDAQNIVFTKGTDTYILFINPNEEKDSKLFYDLLKAEQSNEIMEESTFEEAGNFGFAAIVKSGKDDFELIASVGGAKMTTVAKKRNMETDLGKMMEIVRSVEQD
ncbi:hypothetical protein AB1K83_04270 [Sporosarcina sp. 179-K 3D1 HS]|uniref:hypothetical protein n=1 Tax=Sporosarcina sp. 179-K 3D1 HS TaxID=3232169 RepID=UPI0039A26064